MDVLQKLYHEHLLCVYSIVHKEYGGTTASYIILAVGYTEPPSTKLFELFSTLGKGNGRLTTIFGFCNTVFAQVNLPPNIPTATTGLVAAFT